MDFKFFFRKHEKENNHKQNQEKKDNENQDAKKSEDKKLKAQEKKQRLKSSIERAGFDINTKELSKIFFNAAIGINLAISLYLVYFLSSNYGITWSKIAAWMLLVWVFVFLFLWFAIWIGFYILVDYRIFKRKTDVEEVLPDFLQLAASNINAGMPIDRALWYAVRPRFGVLAKEIEMIAKETMAGVDLKTALERFAARYDSVTLKRTVNMINEGLEAGGKIGELLNRIADDIQQQKALMKEMSANVTTYVIFITFSTIVAAPFLFALSGVLINVVQGISSSLGGNLDSASSVGVPISFSGSGVSIGDFTIFGYVSLGLSAFFSALMISVIKKGNVKSGIKYIPIFMAVSFLIYMIAQKIMNMVLGVFIQF
ncbi:MAG: type II secretion system F family protein [Nanoarchaeota archaeon]